MFPTKAANLAYGRNPCYSVFNVSPILAVNTRYGQSWLQPLQILDARLVKFGIHLNS